MKNWKTFLAVFVFTFISALILAADAEKETTLQLFQRHYLQRGNYKDLPLPGEDVGTLKLFAARDEYEPVQFLLRSPVEIKDISVSLESDLKGESVSISKDNLSIRLVFDQKHWLDTRRFERIPYLLMDKKSFDLKANQTERVWVTVHVPMDAKAGIYSGTLKVTASGKLFKSVPIELTVWPFELKKPTPDEMAYFMYFGMELPDWMKNKTYLKNVFSDMKEHGMNSVTAYTSSISANDYLDAMRESGMLQKNGKFIWLGAANAGAEEIGRTNEIVERKDLEIVYYGVDEPSTEAKQELQKKITAKLKKICPNKKIITTLDGEKTINAVGDYLDTWILEAIDLNNRTRKEADEKKKIMYSYECRLSPVDPLNSRYYWGFMVWTANAKGAAHWYYGSSTYGSISNRFGMPIKNWQHFDSEYQYKFDYVFCTPDGIAPSIGWEGGVREGIDDYRYIFTLSKWIETARKNGKTKLATDGEKLLADIKAKINPENYRKAFDEVCNKKENGRSGEIGTNFHRPSPEPGLKVTDYDAMRRQIAREIVKIAAAMEKKE